MCGHYHQGRPAACPSACLCAPTAASWPPPRRAASSPAKQGIRVRRARNRRTPKCQHPDKRGTGCTSASATPRLYLCAFASVSPKLYSIENISSGCTCQFWDADTQRCAAAHREMRVANYMRRRSCCVGCISIGCTALRQSGAQLRFGGRNKMSKH